MAFSVRVFAIACPIYALRHIHHGNVPYKFVSALRGNQSHRQQSLQCNWRTFSSGLIKFRYVRMSNTMWKHKFIWVTRNMSPGSVLTATQIVFDRRVFSRTHGTNIWASGMKANYISSWISLSHSSKTVKTNNQIYNKNMFVLIFSRPFSQLACLVAI